MKKIYLKTLLTFVLSLLSIGLWAQSGPQMNVEYTIPTSELNLNGYNCYKIPSNAFLSEAESAKITIQGYDSPAFYIGYYGTKLQENGGTSYTCTSSDLTEALKGNFYFFCDGSANIVVKVLNIKKSSSTEDGEEKIPEGDADGDSDNTPTNTGLTDLGHENKWGQECYSYSYKGTAAKMVKDAIITITTSANNVDCFLNSDCKDPKWKTQHPITLTEEDVTALAATDYTFWMEAWQGPVTNVTITVPGGGGTTTDPEGSDDVETGGTTDPEEDETDTTPYEKDRTNAFGYAFTNAQLKNYPQLTDVPTVYLNVYAPDSYDTGTYANNDIKTGTPQTLAANYQLAANSKITEKKYNWYYQTQIIVRDDNGKMKERNELTTVRARGNSTWRWSDKKPLRLKFPSKTRFLATSADDKTSTNAKSWTLLANSFDKSMLRNGLTHELVDYINKVDNANNLPFNPACQYVDLVVNGEYWGTYQISDQVQVGPGRVDVDADNGWFVEYTINSNGFVEEPFLKIGSSYVNIKNPEDPNIVDGDPNSTTQLADNQATKNPIYDEMKTMLNNLNTSIKSIVGWDENYASSDWMQYIDTRSLIDWFIAMDVTGNYDGCIANDYLYKDVTDKKLKVGPLWDLDLGFGNKQEAKNHFYTAQGQGITYSIQAMLKDPYFVKKLYERWQQIYNNGALTTYLNDKVTALSSTLAQTQAENYKKWKLSEGNLGKKYSTYQAAVNDVVAFNNAHIPWLETEYKRLYDSMGCADLEDIADDDEDKIDDTPIASTEIEQKIANKQQLTNLATVYMTVPDALNEDGTRKDINSVVFKKDGVADYHKASIEVVDNGTDGTGRQIVLEHEDKLNIKVRGNETAKEGVTKLPYRLKFEKDDKDPITGEVLASHKYDMLGLGYKKRNWVLLANKNDGTLMHNALAYTIGKAVGMDFCPGYKFVDLVINGEYRGNYQISDHCEVDQNRINVDADNGWYLEANGNSQWEEPFVNPTGLYISIKSPEPDANSAEETQLKNEVLSYFNNCTALFDIWDNQEELSEEKQAALTNPNTGWRKYWDEESLINYYIGVNVTGNHDGFMTVKMYRNPGEKVKFGPLWDFDTSFGNYDNGTTLSEDAQLGSPIFCNFIHKLVQYDPVFVKKIHDKLHEVIDAGLQKKLLDEVDKLEVMLSKSQATENPNQLSGAYAASVQGLRDYINAHFTWLVETIDAKYVAMGGDDIVIPDDPDIDDPDDTPTGDLGALVDLGDGKYSYTGSASTFKEGTEITITTSEGTTLSNYITEGNEWNTTKTITLTADDVTTLAANSYTFFMNATGGEVKAVNVKVPVAPEVTGLVDTGEQRNNGNLYIYRAPKSAVKVGSTLKVTIDGSSAFFYASDKNTQFDGIYWGTTYEKKLTQEVVDKIIANNYSIDIVVSGGACTSAEMTSASSGGSTDTPSTPTTPTYTLTLSASEGGTVIGAGTYDEGTTVLIKAIPNEGYRFSKWSDDNTHASRSVTLNEAITLTATFVSDDTPATRQQLTNLPTIYLDAATVDDAWKGVALEVFDKDNVLGQGITWTKTTADVSAQYQGSGDKNKDSYRLKFESKIKLMGANKYKQWVLLANDDDPSMINNALAKELGDAVGMPWTPGYQFVDLYVNDEYMGTYQVTDRVKAEEGRSLVSGGNKDNDWQVRFNDEGEYNEDKPTYYIAGTETMPYIIPKNPDPKDDPITWNSTLKDDMTTYFNTVFTKNTDGTYPNFAANVDKEQLINWYICQEILGVYKGFSSIEAYRSVTETAADKLLHFGPLWDSEKAFGNHGEADAIDMSDLNADTYLGLMTNYAAYDEMKSLFNYLWTQPWFGSGVRDKWNALKTAGLLATLKDKADDISATLSESQPKNAEKWTESLGGSTYETAIANIKSYLDTRFDYLDTKFNARAAGLCEHTFTYVDNNDGTHKHYCTKCDYTDVESEAHTLTMVSGKAKCSVCELEMAASVTGNEGEKVYILNAGKAGAQYITKTSGFAPTANTLYSINEKPEEGTVFDNVYWTENGTNYADNIIVTDGTAWLGDVKVSAKNATYSRTMSASSVWGTVCLPFKTEKNDDVTLYQLSESTADNKGNGTMVFIEAGSTGGLTPLVYKKNKASATNVSFKCSAQADGYVTVKAADKMSKNTSKNVPTNWQFNGNVKGTQTLTTTATATPALYYIASNKFWHATGTLDVSPFRAYFSYTPPTPSAAKVSMFSISTDDNLVTDITSVNATRPLAIFTNTGSVSIVAPRDMKVSIYSANGMLVETIDALKDTEYSVNLATGIYMVNGLKFVVK